MSMVERINSNAEVHGVNIGLSRRALFGRYWSMLDAAYVTRMAHAQTKYSPAYFEAAFYECRKLAGGWPFVPAGALRKMYNMGDEL